MTDFSTGMDDKYAFSSEEDYTEGMTQTEQCDNAFTDASVDSARTSYQSVGKSNVFERYKDPTKQFTGTRSYHQDHSSVGGLTAKDINKARESKQSISKPQKQMVNKADLVARRHPNNQTVYCAVLLDYMNLVFARRFRGFFFFWQNVM